MIKPRVGQTGFTIVELLIVIVVIGILVAITVVAYSGIQARARDATRTTDIKQVQTAIEMYYVDIGNYPSSGTDNVGINFSTLVPLLVPKYIARLPSDPKGGASYYQYVRGDVASGSYGIWVQYEAKDACHLGTKNAGLGWWSVGAC